MGITIRNYNFDVYVGVFKKYDATVKSFTEHLEFFDKDAVKFFCESTGMFPEDLDYAYEVFQNNDLSECFYSSINDLLVINTRTLSVCESNIEKLTFWIKFLLNNAEKLENKQTIEFQIKVLKNMLNQWIKLKTEKTYIKKTLNHRMMNFTFLGVMFHEMMHCLGCLLTGTKIYTISLFNNNYDTNDGLKCGFNGHAYGLVQRENTGGKALKSFLISFSPLIFGLPISALFFSEVDLSIEGLLFLWVGFSICYNSIPSSGDIDSYTQSRIVNKKYIDPKFITKLLMLPFVIIYAAFSDRKFSFVFFTFFIVFFAQHP